MKKLFFSALLGSVIVCFVGVTFFVLYRPNFQVTEVNISEPMIKYTERLILNGMVFSPQYFSYKANEAATYTLDFNNNIMFTSTKSVALIYSIDGETKVDEFDLPPGARLTRDIDLLPGQSLSGNFTISGGAVNDLSFISLVANYTQSIDFSFKLSNNGLSDGSVTVELRSDGQTAWSNRYHFAAGEYLNENDTVKIPDKETHTFEIVTSN